MILLLSIYGAVTLLAGIVCFGFAVRRIKGPERVAVIVLIFALIGVAGVTIWMSYR